MTDNIKTILNIPYGDDPCQFVNLYLPADNIKGLTLRIHGGGWQSGNVPPWVPATEADPLMLPVAEAGYALIDVNYRGINNNSGSNGNGYFPNNMNDIITVLKYCTVDMAGNEKSPVWKTIYDLIQKVGFMVEGVSAGGHLAIMGVCTYGTETNLWPLRVVSAAGPLDLDYKNFFLEPIIHSLIDTVAPGGDLKVASPFSRYGTDSNPGPWFNAVNSSNCIFHFVHNLNDTIVTNVMSMPTIMNFKEFNGKNTIVELISLGPAREAFDGMSPAVFKGPTPDNTSATLPTTGNMPGDTWNVGTTLWVYNEGTYPGGGIIPASVNGFTRWFEHNFENPTAEVDTLIRMCSEQFEVKKKKSFLEKLLSILNKIFKKIFN